MSRFSGPQGKGAVRRHKEVLREEAEERNEKTDPRRRRGSVAKALANSSQIVDESDVLLSIKKTDGPVKVKVKKSKAIQISERGVRK